MKYLGYYTSFKILSTFLYGVCCMSYAVLILLWYCCLLYVKLSIWCSQPMLWLAFFTVTTEPRQLQNTDVTISVSLAGNSVTANLQFDVRLGGYVAMRSVCCYEGPVILWGACVTMRGLCYYEGRVLLLGVYVAMRGMCYYVSLNTPQIFRVYTP